jgi:hypothetical protein
LRFLHGQLIVHRDVKPENLLISLNDQNDWHIVLIDYDTVREIDGTGHYTKTGTVAYMAPECHTLTPYNYKVDTWSLGILLYQLLVCSLAQTPASDIRDDRSQVLIHAIMRRQLIEKGYSRDITELILSMLRHDRTLRPSAEQLYAYVLDRSLERNTPQGELYHSTETLLPAVISDSEDEIYQLTSHFILQQQPITLTAFNTQILLTDYIDRTFNDNNPPGTDLLVHQFKNFSVGSPAQSDIDALSYFPVMFNDIIGGKALAVTITLSEESEHCLHLNMFLIALLVSILQEQKLSDSNIIYKVFLRLAETHNKGLAVTGSQWKILEEKLMKFITRQYSTMVIIFSHTKHCRFIYELAWDNDEINITSTLPCHIGKEHHFPHALLDAEVPPPLFDDSFDYALLTAPILLHSNVREKARDRLQVGTGLPSDNDEILFLTQLEAFTLLGDHDQIVKQAELHQIGSFRSPASFRRYLRYYCDALCSQSGVDITYTYFRNVLPNIDDPVEYHYACGNFIATLRDLYHRNEDAFEICQLMIDSDVRNEVSDELKADGYVWIGDTASCIPEKLNQACFYLTRAHKLFPCQFIATRLALVLLRCNRYQDVLDLLINNRELVSTPAVKGLMTYAKCIAQSCLEITAETKGLKPVHNPTCFLDEADILLLKLQLQMKQGDFSSAKITYQQLKNADDGKSLLKKLKVVSKTCYPQAISKWLEDNIHIEDSSEAEEISVFGRSSRMPLMCRTKILKIGTIDNLGGSAHIVPSQVER